MRKIEIQNAKITGTMLGIEDHGIMSFFVYLEWQGGGVGFGGYTLDGHDSETGGRRGSRRSIEAIRLILETVGVGKWEDLEGKHVRVETAGIGSRSTKIGHIIEDRWFDIEEHFALEPR